MGYTTSIPFTIVVSDMNDKELFTVKRSFSLFRPNMNIYDENQVLVGIIKRSAWWALLANSFLPIVLNYGF